MNNNDNSNNKKLLLKNILLLLNKDRLLSKLNNNNKYMTELNNKGNNLQHLNNMNVWKLQNYNYNKNNTINNYINMKLINKLLYKIMSLNNNKIIMSIPTYNINLNNINIKFYYYSNNMNNNVYYMNMINKLMNRLNINYDNLSNILSYYYNKKVIIEPIKLKYIYMNNEIMTKYISLLDNNKYNNGLLMEYQRTLNNIMPKLNDHNISMNYINNINNINKNKYNNIMKYNNNINNIYNNMDINNIGMNILMFKYLTGWSIMLKGRLNKNSNRTTTTLLNNGTFNNKKYLWGNLNNNFKLNYINSNNNIYNYPNINKNGKYNIKVKLNYI
uniref:Small ribosomal subunit protein uS3m n=1 Tax=Nakaseomyces nivariensis TaxID=418086 RepID=A0A2D0W3V2_9SACH|nr:ribosomal protein S3 [Nakaseomyces nivariensis]APD15136.1 ribosomal protein S3 [Nakaseomyces nivariensis]